LNGCTFDGRVFFHLAVNFIFLKSHQALKLTLPRVDILPKNSFGAHGMAPKKAKAIALVNSRLGQKVPAQPKRSARAGKYTKRK
jgi:hypothetical protein